MKNIYPVGQVTHYLKESIEADDFLADLWVTGELSNVTRSSAGHLYFTLKDMLGQIRSVMFRSALTGDVAASDGDSVIAHGRISFLGPTHESGRCLLSVPIGSFVADSTVLMGRLV